MKPLIEVSGLNFRYGTEEILHAISLSVESGEIMSVIGPNGCGKSTLLSAIASLNDRFSDVTGTIKISGKKLSAYNRKELARTISVLPQGRDVPSITVRHLAEHGRFPHLDMSRHLTAHDNEIVEHALEITGMTEFAGKNLMSLSGGERQRAYIAMTLAQDTPIILMDEPTTYLDINYRYELMDIIENLREKYAKTIITVLHDIDLALKYSSRILIMAEGSIIDYGTPADIISRKSIDRVFKIHCESVTIDGHAEYIISR